MKKLTFLLCLLFAASAFGQTTHNSRNEAEKNSGQGIVFKTPDKFMRAPLAGFKGMLMLNPDSAAAIAISYPNENESIEALAGRLLTAVPGFFGDVKGQEVQWKSKPIDVNDGDKPNSGILYTAVSGDTELQFASFQRQWKGLTLVYGYFAMRSPKSKDVKKYWLDESGRGVKPFEKFWKSFSKE